MSGPEGDPVGFNLGVKDICPSLCVLLGLATLRMPALFITCFPNTVFFCFLFHSFLYLHVIGLYLEGSTWPHSLWTAARHPQVTVGLTERAGGPKDTQLE